METLQPVGRHPELQEALMMTMTINDDYEDDNGNDNKNSNDNTNHRNQRAKSPLQTREINRSTQIIIAIVNIFNINCSYRCATITAIAIIMIIMIFRYFEAKKRSNYVGDMSR